MVGDRPAPLHLQIPPRDWQPCRDALDLWVADLDQAPPLGVLRRTLTQGEQERCDRYQSHQLRHRFTAGRALLRGILSRYLGMDPLAVPLVYGDRGKPYLDPASCQIPPFPPDPAPDPSPIAHIAPDHPQNSHSPDLGDPVHPEALAPWHFNLSHCQQYSLCAVSPQPVGVDLEALRSFPQALALGQRFFAPEEWDQLQAQDSPQREELFFRYWVCKEAYVKATGQGLAHHLDQVILDFAPQAHFRQLPPGSIPWRLQELTPFPDTVAAVVYGHAPGMVRSWRGTWCFLTGQEPRYNS